MKHIIPVFVLLAVTLSACVQTPVETETEQAWDTRRDELMRLENWDLKGRISIRSENYSGSGSLYWAQHKDEYDIRVIASLPGRVYEFSGSGGVISLQTSCESVIQTEDAETLLNQALEWYFPVSELVYWIRGLPTPALPVHQLLFDEANRVSTLSQAGWSVHYKRYIGIDGTSMPERLDLENDHMHVRLFVRQWNLP